MNTTGLEYRKKKKEERINVCFVGGNGKCREIMIAEIIAQ